RRHTRSKRDWSSDVCSSDLKKAVDADKAWEELQEKYDQGTVFETEIKEIVKGGLVVDVGLRGFIPASLVETYFVEDFSDYKDREIGRASCRERVTHSVDGGG